MRSPASSLRTRLLLAVSVLALTAVAAVALAVRQSTRREFRKFQELDRISAPSTTDADARRIASVLDGRCCGQAVVREASGLLSAQQIFFVVDRARGDVVTTAGPAGDRFSNLRIRVDGDRVTLDGRRARDGTSEDITLHFRGGPAQSIALEGGGAGVVRIITLPRPDKDSADIVFLGSVDRRLLTITALVGALALAATWILTRRITGPIGELRDAARDLATGDLSRRVTARGSDEVAELARGFNAMASGLERQQLLRRSLVHDVAHELRTPLTALRCRLETIIDGMTRNPSETVRGAHEEVCHLSRLVDDLQELALAEAGELRLHVTAVGVAEVVDSAARAAGLENDPRLQSAIDNDLAVRGDAVRVRQILVNLLTNADRHTPRDGTIAVRARATPSSIEIEIQNTGSTLDDEQMAQVFDRFYRADPSRQRTTGGTGLGLAIVKHLAEAQGGRVWVRRESTGMTFGVAFPIDEARGRG
ncbi:MAG TPA: ATP-binding protein [Vicinamibacterales bacterium]|jgi:signal transduction histidine kinase